MNIKKIVGAVSALAVSASLFSGFTFTVNAETWQKIYENASGTSVVQTSSSTAKDTTLSLSGVDGLDSGKLKVEYTVETNVDFSNTSGSRVGQVNLNTSNGPVILSIYANTAKSNGFRRYAVGNWAGISTAIIDNSTDNSDSHYYDVELIVDVDNDKVSGSITNDRVSVIINEQALTVDKVDSFYLRSASAANKMSVKNIVISKEAVEPVLPSAEAEIVENFEGTDGTKASLWSAVLKGTGATYNRIKAIAAASDGTEGENTVVAPTITSDGEVNVFVAVDKAETELNGVTVEALNVAE